MSTERHKQTFAIRVYFTSMPSLSRILLKTTSMYFWICLAIHNHLVFGFFSVCYVHVMLVCEPVVPTAVPSSERVSVTLPGVGELSAGQSLTVKESLSVRVSTEIDLSFIV